MNATNCDRYGFELNGRHHTYGDLRHYVCNECGGAVGHTFPRVDGKTIDHVACMRCGCEDIVSESRYLEQIAEGWEVERGLPEPLRALLRGGSQCLSAIEAAADLSV